MRISSIGPSYNNYRNFNKARTSFKGEEGQDQSVGKKGLHLPSKKELKKDAVIFTLAGLIGSGATIAVTNNTNLLNQKQKTVTVPYYDSMDVNDVADKLGIEQDIIFVNPDEKQMTINVPFDYLEDTIQNAVRKFRKQSSDEKKLASNFGYISDLREKQAYQKGISTMYTDGEFVYISLVEGVEMDFETFKRTFDIKDGALTSYEENEMTSEDWSQGEISLNTGKNIPSGQTFKISIDDIEKDNIDFSY